ncbi:MAG: 1,4-dihydroxy-6-naphthoate synthase [Verrucomicrobia bacterium]|nr:1,4-dihydroxy-6-naphthoate synthase [Verrucomicrobiota bacterium]
MVSSPYSIAFSPCPNDTFAFHAWVAGLLDAPPPRALIADIEQLNTIISTKTPDLCKVSFPALASVLDTYALLPVGVALGRGVGPLLVAKEPFSLEALEEKKVALPGQKTTAHLLLSLLAPPPQDKLFCLYHETLSHLSQGTVDAALIIHEQRFTYEKKGFHLIADLGALWEECYQQPIPLGGLAVRRELVPVLASILQASLAYAYAHPEASQSYLLQHSHEKNTKVIQKHIETYVTEDTFALSQEGEKAIDTLFSIARAKHLLPEGPCWRCS